MADVVVKATQPTLAAIKLAWWRERLQELDHGAVPAEPRLQAAARELLPRGIKGSDLAGLEAGWAELLTEHPDPARAQARGTLLFALAGRLLGGESDTLEHAGRLFSRASLQRQGYAVEVPETAFVARVPRILRPITGLGALAKRDLRRGGGPFEAEATPARAWVLLMHRLTGRI